MNQVELNDYMQLLNTRFDKGNKPYNYGKLNAKKEDMYFTTGSLSPIVGESLEASVERFYRAGWSNEKIVDNLFNSKTADKQKLKESPSYQAFCGKVAKITSDLRNSEPTPKNKRK